jgi:chromate transporter
MKLLHLFYAFLRVGLLGYGGGPSSIPLVHKEVVENYKWMSSDEFADILALGNTLPGPISTKIAGYIGYRVAGMMGMLVAIGASVVPTLVIMIILLTSLSSFKDLPWVAGMTKAVVPVVGVMMATLTWSFFKNATGGLGWKIAIVLTIGSYIALELLHIHPGILIAVLLGAALLKRDVKKNKQDHSN